MPARMLNARDVLKDIAAGMDSEGLMTKYQLSFKDLQNVYGHLMEAGLLELVDGSFEIPPIRRLSARRILRDIRSGMHPETIRDKYLLSPAQLQKTVDILLENNLVTADQLRQYAAGQIEDVGNTVVRESERCYLDFELPIVDTGPPEIDGIVRDLSEKGVGIAGVPAQLGDVKTFLVFHDELVLVEPFMFEARCRWVARKEPRNEVVTGFQITHISEKDREELRKLIRLVTFYA